MLARIIKTFNILQFCCIAYVFESYALRHLYDWRFFTLSVFAVLSIIFMIYYTVADKFDKLKLNNNITAIVSILILLFESFVLIYDKPLLTEHYVISIYCILDCIIWFIQKNIKKYP